MNREQFLKELDFLLQDISPEEREDALFYYEDYFAEAGQENEEKVIRELQSPERVAALIKAGLDNTFEDTIEYSENSMKNNGYQKQDEVVINTGEHGKETYTNDGDSYQGKHHYNRKTSGFQGNPERNRILLIVIIITVAIFGLPIFGTGLGVLISIFIILFCLGIVFGALGFASMVAATVMIVKGASVFIVYPGAGLISIGIGVLFIGLGIFLFGNVKWPFTVVPNIIHGVVEGVKSIIDKVGNRL